MIYKEEEIEWNTPLDYGFKTEKELEYTGFYDISELLNLESPQMVYTICTDDSDKALDLYSLISSIFLNIKTLGSSILYKLNGVNIVCSYYEGGLYSISFDSDDKEKVEKQLLSL